MLLFGYLILHVGLYRNEKYNIHVILLVLNTVAYYLRSKLGHKPFSKIFSSFL